MLGFPAVGGADLLDPALGFQAFGPTPPPGVVVPFGALGLPPPVPGPGSVDIDALSFGTDPITLLTLGGPDHIVFSADRLSTGGFLPGSPRSTRRESARVSTAPRAGGSFRKSSCGAACGRTWTARRPSAS